MVLPQIGDGPLNIVVEGAPGDFVLIEPATPARLEESGLQIGGVAIDLHGAEVWEPRPDWVSLRANYEFIANRLPFVQAVALHQAAGGSLLEILPDPSPTARAGTRSGGSGVDLARSEIIKDGLWQATSGMAREGAMGLGAGWLRGPAQLRAGAARLAGLGGGLTPAGDDFLTGVMLWAWLTHPAPGPLCKALLEAATPRTTILSAAFLRAAADGECSAPWHRFFAVLESGTKDQLTAAVQGVLSHGSTSGADTLAGLLWMGHVQGAG